MLPVVYPLEDIFHSGTIASELVSYNYPGSQSLGLQKFAEKLIDGTSISAALHQDIDDLAILIDGSPQIVLLPLIFDLHLIQMPLISWLGTAATELIGISLSKLEAPASDRAS